MSNMIQLSQIFFCRLPRKVQKLKLQCFVKEIEALPGGGWDFGIDETHNTQEWGHYSQSIEWAFEGCLGSPTRLR